MNDTPETPLDAPEDPTTGPDYDIDGFKKDLEHIINLHCIENLCDIPDFILAESIVQYLDTLATTVQRRDDWFGVDMWHDKNGKEVSEVVGTVVEIDHLDTITAELPKPTDLFTG